MENENKKRKFSFRKLVYNDRYLIVCSIIAAVIIWITSSMTLSPETTKTITVPVTVDFTDTLAEQLGIAYYGNSDLTVEVTVSCKKYIAKDITEKDITASLQTSNVTSTGYLSVPININIPADAEFKVDHYFPTSAQGYYDVAQEAAMPIELNYLNDDFAADGYVVGDVVINQSTAVIKGPRSYISSVEKVVADVNLESGLTESQRVNLQPRAVDENNNIVNYVTVVAPESENFVANVPILKVQNLRPAVSFVSGPDNAADILDVRYSVTSVQVGALESNASNELMLGNISFSDLTTGENTFTFDTSQLSGIKVLDGTKEITVTVTVPDNYASKTIPIYRRDIKPDLKDYNVSVTGISSNSVTVIAAEDVIESIDKSSLTLTLAPMEENGTIDEKTTKCRVVFSVSSQGSCWVLGDYTVTVNVTPK
ncbi:MAG: YbbR-like domain-containing protein [Eubacterium sp.]